MGEECFTVAFSGSVDTFFLYSLDLASEIFVSASHSQDRGACWRQARDKATQCDVARGTLLACYTMERFTQHSEK